ncbi:5-methyltetrahydropteroyltriglutamate--homocysteine methyltransferase [bacterium]|nr:5-methyltetrahydropteroyltriglutamate--homocysteine methyltransferase [bacterium]
MIIPTEPIGSIPRRQKLMDAVRKFANSEISKDTLDAIFDLEVKSTIEEFEATGSPVITDGEQSKPSFVSYPIVGWTNLNPAGISIRFADGHTRQLPSITSGPFRYATYASQYLEKAKKYAHMPVKQAVISASALSLLYPQEGIQDYSREQFIEDLLHENESDIRKSLDGGAYDVQIDFTEGRLAVKLDPSKGLLKQFVKLNNQVLSRFSAAERKQIGIHTCPGGDQDSTHSADVDYVDLLPDLFELQAGNFFIQLASEKDRIRVLKAIAQYSKPDQKVFIGVTNPIDARVETPEEIRDEIVTAANYIPLDRLGTTDDCGFSPFGDDTSTSREIAFQKIRARVIGTQMAAAKLSR